MKYFPHYHRTADTLSFRYGKGTFWRPILFLLAGAFSLSWTIWQFVELVKDVPAGGPLLLKGIVLMMAIIAATTLLIIIGVQVMAVLWAMFGQVRVRLDADGLHYVFRIIIPLQHYFIPLAEIAIFRVAVVGQEEDGSGGSISVQARTLTGTLSIITNIWYEDQVEEIQTLFRDLNDVLRRLRSGHLSKDAFDELEFHALWEDEIIERDDPWHPVPGIEPPEAAAWDVKSDMETLLFRRKFTFSLWNNYLAAILATLGTLAVLLVLTSAAPLVFHVSEIALPAVCVIAVGGLGLLWIGGWLLYYAVVRLSDFGRWEYFGKRGNCFTHGDTAFGIPQEKTAPWKTWYTIALKDTGEDLRISPFVPLFTTRRTVTSCVLEVRDLKDELLMKLEGLTRREGQWLRDAMMEIR